MIETYYNNILKEFEKINGIIGYIDSFPETKKDKFEYIIKVIGIKYIYITDYIKVQPFNIIIKLKSSDNINLRRGDIIQINKNIRLPQKRIFNFNYREYLFYHKIYGIIQGEFENIKIIKNKVKIQFFYRIFERTIWRFRDNFIILLKKNLSFESYSFLLSIYFGNRNEMDKDLYEAFCNTGMVHLLAISGLHIGFIGMLFFGLFKLFLSKSKSLILSVILLLFYILIIVPSPSSLRAFLMYLIFAFYFVTGIRTSTLSILSFSAIILMFDNPFVVFNISFQFSYLATAGILLLSDSINDRLPKILDKKIKSSIIVTFSAFLSIFTLQWAIFQKVPFFSLISSIIVVPLFALFFSLNFFLLFIFWTTRVIYIAKIIDFISFLFLKIIGILDLIKPINMPEIPKFLAYLFLPLLLVYFYLLEPFLKKTFIKIKSKKVEKLIKITSNSEKI